MQSPIYSGIPRAFLLTTLLLLTLFYNSSCTQNKVSGKHLRIGNGAEPATLDPQKCASVECIRIIHSLFEGLSKPLKKGFTSGMAQWSVDSSATRYTFVIKDKQWQDGTPLTAKDFEYSWQRLIDPATGSPYATLLDGVESFAARGLDTFYVQLKAPMAYFIELCAFGPLLPSPRHLIEKYGPAWTQPENLTANGPYQMVEWLPNQRILLKKNPSYSEAKSVNIDYLSFYAIDDVNTELMIYLSGQLDWIFQVPPARLKYYEDNPEFNNSPKYGTYIYRVNQAKGKLLNTKARLALNYSIDRELLVKSVTQGGEEAAGGLVPSGVDEYQPYRPFSYLPDSARALWKAASLEDSLPQEVELLYNQSETNKKIAEAIGQMWQKELGLKVNLANVEWKTLLSKMKNLEYEVIRGSWIGDYQDPVTFLELFHSQSGNNRTGWSNPSYDSLLEESIRETNPARRFAKLHQLEKILLDDPPIIPIYFYRNKELRKPKIKGITENAMGVYNFAELDLEEQ